MHSLFTVPCLFRTLINSCRSSETNGRVRRDEVPFLLRHPHLAKYADKQRHANLENKPGKQAAPLDNRQKKKKNESEELTNSPYLI